jgi:hypothetical protein
VTLRNTSTGAPAGFTGAALILSGVSWDMRPASGPAAPEITGGSVRIGSASLSINFSTGQYGPGTDVSREWGYANRAQSGLLNNYLSTISAGATQLAGANLDGPDGLGGPGGGLISAWGAGKLGGQGAVQSEVVADLTLSRPLTDLSFLGRGVVFEFGSDAAFVCGTPTIPAPATAGLGAALGLAAARRRRDPAPRLSRRRAPGGTSLPSPPPARRR